ncbi:MAG TPA: hypothetical protein VN752_06720 [Solirubrobacterales bacterium]|nr:hypothetical protein [Solirubrobacterales bacterium]
MSKHAPLQARLHTVNHAIADQQQARDSAPLGSKIRKHAKAALRRLNKQRKKLVADRFKFKGATAIIKYEVIPILHAAGVPVTSRKRWATFGNPSSDHWLGNRDADAVDGATFAENNELGSAIVSALKQRKTEMSSFAEFEITRSHTGSAETYRVQVITEEHGTGPHIHIGVKRVSS